MFDARTGGFYGSYFVVEYLELPFSVIVMDRKQRKTDTQHAGSKPYTVILSMFFASHFLKAVCERQTKTNKPFRTKYVLI